MITKKDIEYIYKLLDIEMCDFDCGKVCSSKRKNQMPYCCENVTAMPVLYREEYKFLRPKTKMWKMSLARTHSISNILAYFC